MSKSAIFIRKASFKKQLNVKKYLMQEKHYYPLFIFEREEEIKGEPDIHQVFLFKDFLFTLFTWLEEVL